MKLSAFVISCALWLSPSAAAEVVPDQPKWPVVGTAELSVLWFDIYRAELSAVTGKYNPEQPYMLHLTYLRDFSADELVDETFKQMKTDVTDEQERTWRRSLLQIWPDVSAGDSIGFVTTATSESLFFVNNNYAGRIDDPAFAPAFGAIWLAKDSAYPKLAKQLKGL